MASASGVVLKEGWGVKEGGRITKSWDRRCVRVNMDASFICPIRFIIVPASSHASHVRPSFVSLFFSPCPFASCICHFAQLLCAHPARARRHVHPQPHPRPDVLQGRSVGRQEAQGMHPHQQNHHSRRGSEGANCCSADTGLEERGGTFLIPYIPSPERGGFFS